MSPFYWANKFFYKFAQQEKPFENETQFLEAVELHDELNEILINLPNEVDAFGTESDLSK